MALAGLIRLQMKAEKDKATKAMEVRRSRRYGSLDDFCVPMPPHGR